MGYSTTYSSLIHPNFSRLIYHTSKQSSASTQACISLSRTNRAYSIGLSMARAFNAHFEFGETHKKLLIKYPPDNNVEDTTSTPSNIFQLNTLIKSYKMSIIIVRRKEVMICQLQQLN